MKPFRAILILLLLASVACAEWYRYNPAGAVDGQGILQDVTSRCDEQGRRTAYEPDRVTYCHEATHMLNSRIRKAAGGNRVNAFYVGGGMAVVLKEPGVQLRTVAGYVSPELRNSTYKLYFIEQAQHWNNEPLYVLDEWSAYCNGSQAARELGCDPHGTHERAIWFCHFADCVVKAVREHDPDYTQLQDLTEFVEWQKARAKKLAVDQ